MLKQTSDERLEREMRFAHLGGHEYARKIKAEIERRRQAQEQVRLGNLTAL